MLSLHFVQPIVIYKLFSPSLCLITENRAENLTLSTLDNHKGHINQLQYLFFRKGQSDVLCAVPLITHVSAVECHFL